jgi:hypothetical protein
MASPVDGLVRRRSAAQAWAVVDLSAVVVSVVLASSVVRSEVRLEPVPLAAARWVVPELQVWQVVPALRGRQVVLEAWAAQELPRGQPDVLEARLVVA